MKKFSGLMRKARPYQLFVSFSRSGTTVTKAMYRNPPEVKGRIQATVSPRIYGRTSNYSFFYNTLHGNKSTCI